MSLFQIRRYLSAGLLVVNPLCGILMVGSVIELSWYWKKKNCPFLSCGEKPENMTEC